MPVLCHASLKGAKVSEDKDQCTAVYVSTAALSAVLFLSPNIMSLPQQNNMGDSITRHIQKLLLHMARLAFHFYSLVGYLVDTGLFM